MTKKTTLVASSLSLCTASLFSSSDGNSVRAVTEEGIHPHTPDWPKERLAQEALYHYLNPLTSVAEGNLAVSSDKKTLTYQVEKGDTLYGIGLRYGVDHQVLAEMNGIKDPQLLQPGQRLQIPVQFKRIRVKEGQTLTSIAEENDVTVMALKEANPDLILSSAPYVGQVLTLPEEISPATTLPAMEAEKGEVQLAASETGGERSFIRWPVTGQITSRFGMRHGKMHTGIDIWNERGVQTPIRPASSGTVIRAGWGGNYGNLVVVDHGGGWTTYYAHLSQISVSQGQKVSRKSELGRMGTTGNSTGVHLHFEVRRNDQPMNPLEILP
ncbi:murein DD-endopeptidase MepM/ murein hydrolase activator NlpD [Kroppenstedtia sanguinis]|uniref:LysM peptidoglycan-binding domain-containing M23 family metallopeptidase n=1 Tax=Kroppenstedtia sanguinis TaxID=1380684 RepID=UPI003D22C078